jgi:hypothetical protein
MSQASRETFREIKESGALSEQLFRVYRTLWNLERENGHGQTHNEISAAMLKRWNYPPNYHRNTNARLNDLEKLGVVCRIAQRRCYFSGKPCTVWVTVDTLPEKKIQTPLQIAREKFKRARARFIVARDRYLKLKALAGK